MGMSSSSSGIVLLLLSVLGVSKVKIVFCYGKLLLTIMISEGTFLPVPGQNIRDMFYNIVPFITYHKHAYTGLFASMSEFDDNYNTVLTNNNFLEAQDTQYRIIPKVVNNKVIVIEQFKLTGLQSFTAIEFLMLHKKIFLLISVKIVETSLFLQ